jgi:hypothetical protein
LEPSVVELPPNRENALMGSALAAAGHAHNNATTIDFAHRGMEWSPPGLTTDPMASLPQEEFQAIQL